MVLKFKVFLHSYLGFNSNSTLFYGERDAILIDASQVLSDSYRMVAEILPMRRRSHWLSGDADIRGKELVTHVGAGDTSP